MAKDFEIRNDVKPDIGSEVNSDARSDFGGELRGDEGMDLNELNKEYPPNDGFVEGTEEDITLKPGDIFDRYGHSEQEGGNELGYFAAPDGTPYEQRSLDGGKEDRILYGFEVQNPVETKSGITAPYYEQEGGGTQYQFPETIDTMVENSDVRPTSASFEVDHKLPPSEFEGDIAEFIRNDDPYTGVDLNDISSQNEPDEQPSKYSSEDKAASDAAGDLGEQVENELPDTNSIGDIESPEAEPPAENTEPPVDDTPPPADDMSVDDTPIDK